MCYRIKNRDEHFKHDAWPKRILSLDGGGLKGILTIAILQRIEDMLRARHGNNPAFRLCHYFDLIAGTSTGSIIASALTLGWRVEQVRQQYMDFGERIFEKSLLRQGFLRARYDEKKFSTELKKAYGEHVTLGGDELQTGLLVMTKRLDTGSPWPISNNPNGKYFESQAGGVIGNGKYPLWQVVRASAAAPSFFDPESIRIVDDAGNKALEGLFVDGSMSPFNNPALQAVMYATLQGYQVAWPTGVDKLLLVSVGAGAADPSVKKANITAVHSVNALLSLMDDCSALQETLLQWMSSSPTARQIDLELGDLQHDLIANTPLFSYLRYNVDLTAESVRGLDPTLQDLKSIESLSDIDAPENMTVLHELGRLAAERDISDDHFSSIFDLVLQ
ncbi:MAG: hypothetical protein GXP08_04415 [Gammaproteobacteria bacterium]|nr:hypothetical protein [Gammaproteobacteria bacterium]